MFKSHLMLLAAASIVCFSTADLARGEQASQSLSGGSKPLSILTVGNSITLHAPLESIEWTGNWGMAATAPSADYSAQVAKALSRKNERHVQLTRINFASFERTFWQDSKAQKIREIVKAAAVADIIIIQLSDNVSDSDFSTYSFEKHYLAFIQEVSSASQKAQLLCIGPWWSNDKKEQAVSRACRQAGGTPVHISDLSSNAVNKASAERQISNPGVGSHPGDKGMSEIAARVASSVRITGGIK